MILMCIKSVAMLWNPIWLWSFQREQLQKKEGTEFSDDIFFNFHITSFTYFAIDADLQILSRI